MKIETLLEDGLLSTADMDSPDKDRILMTTPEDDYSLLDIEQLYVTEQPTLELVEDESFAKIIDDQSSHIQEYNMVYADLDEATYKEEVSDLIVTNYSNIKGTIAKAADMLSQDEIQDIAQEVSRRIFVGLRKFKGMSKPETWVYRICENTTKSYLVKKNRIGKREFLQKDEDLAIIDNIENFKIDDPSETVVNEARYIRLLSTLLDALSDKLQAVVQLKINGFSHVEIAKILGITESCSKIRLFRASKIANVVLRHEKEVELL